MTALAQKIFKTLLLVFCISYMALDLYIISSRIFYPYQLEWMEGAALIQVQRLLAGQGLYVRPSVDYVPLIYPPLSYYVSMIAAKLIGFGFGALRLISFLSSTVCAIFIFLAIREKTNSKSAGLLGTGVFASAFMLTNQWFDIARPDMLAAALSILGIYLAHEGINDKKYLNTLLSGSAFALAFMSKQSALIVGLAAILYHLIFNWKRGVHMALSFSVSVGIIYGVFWLTSAGWVNYYLFTIPAAHAFSFSVGRIASVLIDQFLPIPIFFIAGLAPILLWTRKIFADKEYRYYFAMAGALIATGTIGRLNAFSARNVFVSSYLGISLLAGLEAGWLAELIKDTSLQKIVQPLIAFEWLLLSIQFGFLAPAYFRTKTIPTDQDRLIGNSLVATIKKYSGDVLVPDDNYLALYAGKTPYYNEIPISEISGQGNLYPMPEWPEVKRQIDLLVHSPNTSAIIVDFPKLINDWIANCRQRIITYPDKSVFMPVAGPNSRPNLIITCK